MAVADADGGLPSLTAPLESVRQLVGALEPEGTDERVSVAEFLSYLRRADAAPQLTMEQRVKAAVDATALAPMRPAGAQQSGAGGLGRERERQNDLDLARQTARALTKQMDRMGVNDVGRRRVGAPQPNSGAMTGSFWSPAPSEAALGNLSADAMQAALHDAEQRVQQQRREIKALEKQMAEENGAAQETAERRARARATAAAVADAAIADVDVAAAADEGAETPVRLQLERLRAQKRERGKKHAEAARRRRDGAGQGLTRRPLECWRENGVDVPKASYSPEAVPAAEQKRYVAERRRFVSEKAPPDEAHAAQQRDQRDIMQGRGSSRFIECRKWVRSLGLRSFPEWLALNSSGARPAQIPADPHRCFANEGWISYEDWLGYKLHDAQVREELDGARREAAADAAEASAVNGARMPPPPPLQSTLAVEGRGDNGPSPSSGGARTTAWEQDQHEAQPVQAFPHASAGGLYDDELVGAAAAAVAGGNWRGWREARRYATGLGMTRSYLTQLAKESAKVSAILELSPGVQRFLSGENTLQAELRECLRHMSQRSLARAYRRWATAAAGENVPPLQFRPADVPVHPEQVYQGYAGPWLTWNDWLGLPEAAVDPAVRTLRRVAVKSSCLYCMFVARLTVSLLFLFIGSAGTPAWRWRREEERFLVFPRGEARRAWTAAPESEGMA
jgi:hypothetical protein